MIAIESHPQSSEQTSHTGGNSLIDYVLIFIFSLLAKVGKVHISNTKQMPSAFTHWKKYNVM